MEDKDNGNKTIEEIAETKHIEGVVMRLGELQRQDGIITESIEKSSKSGQGVIQTVISAVASDANYRQILKLARWHNDHHRDITLAALRETDAAGAWKARKAILDKITAESGGNNGELIREALEALTHTTFTSQHLQDRKRGGKNDSKADSRIT